MIKEIKRPSIKLNDYYCARVVRENNGIKEVLREQCFNEKPTDTEIVEMLMNEGSDCFISVVHNYALATLQDYKYIAF